MEVTLFGVRGSIPTPDSANLRYGGNTSCVLVELEEGQLIFDAGTGIRTLGTRIYGRRAPVHILLTHLHLDHIMGLLFFAPFFDPDAEVTVWGPRGGLRGLRQRLARYLSSPLSPIEIRELPAKVTFAEVPVGSWRLLGAEVSADLVTHRGPTLGYRVDRGKSQPLLPARPRARPGRRTSITRRRTGSRACALAGEADLLIHDAQYTAEEYRHDHRLGPRADRATRCASPGAHRQAEWCCSITIPPTTTPDSTRSARPPSANGRRPATVPSSCAWPSKGRRSPCDAAGLGPAPRPRLPAPAGDQPMATTRGSVNVGKRLGLLTTLRTCVLAR